MAACFDFFPEFEAELKEHLEVMREASGMQDGISRTAALCWSALQEGGKILWCGNGGSAADVQHLSAELVVRFRRRRTGAASLALATDVSVLTATGNDFCFEEIFSRQVEALGRAGDVLVCISTSGTSSNVVAAAMKARAKGISVVSITGSAAGPLSELATIPLMVPSTNTARIQECYLFLGHLLCERLDQWMSEIEEG